MRQIKYTTQFKKDVSLSKKRNKKMGKLKNIVNLLIKDELLPSDLNDHSLNGKYHKHRELHIEPDWLLIYYLPDNKTLHLVRLGSHADLFKK